MEVSVGVYRIAVAEMSARLTPRVLAAVTDDASGRTVDESIVAEKVLDAEAMFHSYTGVYYVTPIAPTSSDYRIARKTVIDLAAWGAGTVMRAFMGRGCYSKEARISSKNALFGGRRPGRLCRLEVPESERVAAPALFERRCTVTTHYSPFRRRPVSVARHWSDRAQLSRGTRVAANRAA